MGDLADSGSAQWEAARLLGTSSDRWDHVVGVAAAARAVVYVVPPDDADLLVAAAWLHDIGYSPAINEAKVRHMRAMLLAEFPPECSVVADALTVADTTTSPTGQPVTVEERLSEILDRYPPTDPVHRAISESSEQLRAAVARVEERLGVRQPR